MKTFITIITSVLCFGLTTHAQTLGETTAPKISAPTESKKSATKSTRNAANKVKEKVHESSCMKGDMKCEAEKEQNRTDMGEGSSEEMKRK